MTRNLRIYLYLLFILSIILLTFHTFDLWGTKVDNISMFLLMFLGLLPFMTLIRKIKWGDFEAEIGINEIKQIEKELRIVPKEGITQQLEPNVPTISGVANYTKDEVLGLKDYLFQLLESDNILALAKLRIELETLLRKVYVNKFKVEDKYYSVSLMINELIESNSFKNNLDYLKPIQQVMNICNRAIHGEKISKENSHEIVRLGIISISYLAGYMSTVEIK